MLLIYFKTSDIIHDIHIDFIRNVENFYPFNMMRIPGNSAMNIGRPEILKSHIHFRANFHLTRTPPILILILCSLWGRFALTG